MKYTKNSIENEREQIFKLFLENNKLKFNEIEKSIAIRSNMVAYHLNKMQKENLLRKKEEYYCLTKTAEKYIPIFSNLMGKELSPLPVVLVALVNKNKILLIKRNKRPYKNYWSLIGGKMLLEETIKKASLRQVMKKTSINAKYISTNAIIHERVHGEGIIKHSFILFFTKLLTKKLEFKETISGELKWVNIKNIGKEKIIHSDLWLIKNKLNSKIDIKNVSMIEKEGKLSNFKIKSQIFFPIP